MTVTWKHDIRQMCHNAGPPEETARRAYHKEHPLDSAAASYKASLILNSL